MFAFGGYGDMQSLKWRNYSSSLKGELVTIIFQWYGDTQSLREIQYMSNILCGVYWEREIQYMSNILCGVYWEREIQYMSNILCGFIAWEREKYNIWV